MILRNSKLINGQITFTFKKIYNKDKENLKEAISYVSKKLKTIIGNKNKKLRLNYNHKFILNKFSFIPNTQTLTIIYTHQQFLIEDV